MKKGRDFSVKEMVERIDFEFGISLHSMTIAELEQLEVAIKYIRLKMPLENLEMTHDNN